MKTLWKIELPLLGLIVVALLVSLIIQEAQYVATAFAILFLVVNILQYFAERSTVD